MADTGSTSQETQCGWVSSAKEPKWYEEWWVYALAIALAPICWYIFKSGIPIINTIIGWAEGGSIVLPDGTLISASSGGLMLASAIGAASILALVASYALKADGCIRSKPDSRPVCCSGIVYQVSNESSSTATIIFAPYAVGPAYIFDVVVKHCYLYLITNGAAFINCTPEGTPLLRCVVKDERACAAKIGSLVGAVVGAVAGTVLGYLAGAAIASLGCGPFAWLCFIAALIVAAIVAAAVAYAGTMAGGAIGYGIGAAAEDTAIEDAAESLYAGATVTVRGDLIVDPDYGYNELFYVTSLCRNGVADDVSPPYTMDKADLLPNDDCVISWEPPR